MKQAYQICRNCIMDTSDPGIRFDSKGICNHCKTYSKVSAEHILPSEKRKARLEELVESIKERGRGREYDCLLGVSGGLDSTYAAYLLKESGLRVLAVHLDNSWNAEIAEANMQTALKKLGIDLYIFKADWKEFKDLQIAFLKAGTPDLEIPSDHAIVAVLFQEAEKRKISYIIEGGNVVSEVIMPQSWACGHWDWKYISSTQKAFGSCKLKSFPHFNFIQRCFHLMTPPVNILNYIDYNKDEAVKLLREKLGWSDYGTKHYESIYTRFVQGYILPKRFGFDKRRAHLSSLVCSGQLKREDALSEIAKDPYPSQELKEQDRELVLTKLGLTNEEFEGIMASPLKRFYDYPSYRRSFMYKFSRFVWRRWRGIRRWQ